MVPVDSPVPLALPSAPLQRLVPEPHAALPAAAADAASPLQLSLGSLHVRARAVHVPRPDGAAPSLIGFEVLNLTVSKLDIERGDVLLGTCASGPAQSAAALAQSLGAEHDCILRQRDGVTQKLMLQDEARDD